MANTPQLCANLTPIYCNSIYVDYMLLFHSEETLHLLQDTEGDSRLEVEDHFKAT